MTSSPRSLRSRALAVLGSLGLVLAALVPALAAAPPAAAATLTDPCVAKDSCSFYLANSWASGPASSAFTFGSATGTPIVGDWTGSGKDLVGVRVGSRYELSGTTGACPASTVIIYGRSADEVYIGDWDGNGTDTLAVRRGNVFYIKNTISGGAADRVIAYGRSGDEVYVGDWDGNGTDTFAVRRGNLFYIKNSLSSGVADKVIAYGRPGDEVLVGDWDGNGSDTFAVRRGSTWYMRNSMTSGVADKVVTYGRAGDTALVGDWDGNGTDTPGVHRTGVAAWDCTPPELTVTYLGQTFRPGSIIADSELFATGTMDLDAVQRFLEERNPSCAAGPDGSQCLKDYTATTTAMDTAYCAPYSAGANETAASILTKASAACGINVKALIVMLQKEQGLVTATGSGLSASKYEKAMGYQCPDNAACDPTYSGLASQVYYAASRLVEYGERPSAFTYSAGGTYDIAYNPLASCGTATIRIENRATAALYNYTPYVPNAAALANIGGSGDSCSSYGNRNFWRNYVTWFGSTGV